MMKKLITILLTLMSAMVVLAENNPAGVVKNPDRPKIAIFVFSSGKLDNANDRFLTDILRTEMFRTKIFDIIERGVVQKVQEDKAIRLDANSDASLLNLGNALKTDKLMVCIMQDFSGTLAANIRIIDVPTTIIEYTENLFVQEQRQLLSGLKDLVTKLSLYYNNEKNDSPALSREARDLILQNNWEYLQATTEQLTFLLENQIEPEEFFDLRQYDINFTIGQFVSAKKNAMDMGSLRSFLQEGIPYKLVSRALSLGLTKLGKYKSEFAPHDVSFEKYLAAYEKNITTYEAYLEDEKGYRRDYFVNGMGGVADQFPLANAEFRFFLSQAAWEHFWTEYQRDWWKFSTEAGLYIMTRDIYPNPSIPAPVPYGQFNVYWGQRPYYVKLGFGGHAEIFLGGHFAATVKAGLEINEVFEVVFVMAPFGTQPRVSYTDLKTKVTDSYGGIVFPYFGALFSFKL